MQSQRDSRLLPGEEQGSVYYQGCVLESIKKVQYQALLGESQHSEAFPIMLVLHLVLIDLGEGNNVASVTKTWEQNETT